MGFGLRVGFLLLLLVAGTLSQVDLFDLFDALDDVPATPAKPKEVPKAPEKPKTDDGIGFDLSDLLHPDPKPSKPFGGGFNLDDALRPAVKPTSGGDCQGTLVQKLNAVMENQKQQLRLLQQLTARYLTLTGPCAECGHKGRHLPEEDDRMITPS